MGGRPRRFVGTVLGEPSSLVDCDVEVEVVATARAAFSLSYFTLRFCFLVSEDNVRAIVIMNRLEGML